MAKHYVLFWVTQQWKKTEHMPSGIHFNLSVSFDNNLISFSINPFCYVSVYLFDDSFG